MQQYSNGFRSRMVQRMAGPEGISATSLSKEVGVSQASLSRWLAAARTVGSVGGSSDSSKARGSKGSRNRTAHDKLRLVQEADSLSEDELGAFLRREGVHEAQLEEWRTAMLGALSSSTKKRPSTKSPEARKLKALEKELDRKEKALAELAALLALKKRRRRSGGTRTTTRPRRARPHSRLD